MARQPKSRAAERPDTLYGKLSNWRDSQGVNRRAVDKSGKETMYGTTKGQEARTRAAVAALGAVANSGSTSVGGQIAKHAARSSGQRASAEISRAAAIDNLVVRSRGQTQIRDANGRTATFKRPEQKGPSGRRADGAPQIGPASIGAAFEAANGKFAAGRNASAEGVSSSKKGWANPKVQAAAQRAKGNQYNGPTE